MRNGIDLDRIRNQFCLELGFIERVHAPLVDALFSSRVSPCDALFGEISDVPTSIIVFISLPYSTFIFRCYLIYVTLFQLNYLFYKLDKRAAVKNYYLQS